jgi:hypothetical protein
VSETNLSTLRELALRAVADEVGEKAAVIFGQTARNRLEILMKGSTLNRFLQEVRHAAVQVVASRRSFLWRDCEPHSGFQPSGADRPLPFFRERSQAMTAGSNEIAMTTITSTSMRLSMPGMMLPSRYPIRVMLVIHKMAPTML